MWCSISSYYNNYDKYRKRILDVLPDPCGSLDWGDRLPWELVKLRYPEEISDETRER